MGLVFSPVFADVKDVYLELGHVKGLALKKGKLTVVSVVSNKYFRAFVLLTINNIWFPMQKSILKIEIILLLLPLF